MRFPPLCAAVANGSTQLALLLLHAGSDPDVRTSDGRQAIHVLNLTRKEEDRATLLEALVNAGADVNATTNSREMQLATSPRARGLHDVLCRLLEFGANMMGWNRAEINQGAPRHRRAPSYIMVDFHTGEWRRIDSRGSGVRRAAGLPPSKDAGLWQRCRELLA